MGERFVHTEEVRGSKPRSPTIIDGLSSRDPNSSSRRATYAAIHVKTSTRRSGACGLGDPDDDLRTHIVCLAVRYGMAVADLSAGPSRELAARIVPLGRALILAEMPLLQANGLGMWDYIILAALRRSAVPTQLELARLTGRDKTRIISNLDDLERAGFVSRARDSADRRATRVEITAAGTDVVRSCHTAIVAMEDELLVGVPDLDRQAFLRVLDALTGQVDQINGSR